MTLEEFSRITGMWEDSPWTVIAWFEFTEQDLPFEEWWAYNKEFIG
jgi:hypothetical protein